jgi:nucleoside-diphosphate-sugar epimerase
MDVLVTGAAGLTGSHLIPALLAAGHRVTAVTSPSSRIHFGGHASLQLLQGDLACALPLPERIDAVVHAAGRSPPAAASQMVHDNAMATARLARYASEAGVATFIYLSSLSVCGHVDMPTVDESTGRVDPDAYGMTKYLGELLVQEHPFVRSLSIRLPGVIGPRSARNWLSAVRDAAKADREIAIYNPEANFNNAVHVADLCSFIVGLLGQANWRGQDTVTLGAAGMITVRRAIETVVGGLGSRSSLRILGERRASHTRGPGASGSG